MAFTDNLVDSPHVNSSDELTSSAVVKATEGALCGVMINTNGANNATVIVYNNPAAASGVKLFEQVVLAASITGGTYFPIPVKASLGLYCSVAGTGASAIVYYL
jgi:hypothetical protein